MQDAIQRPQIVNAIALSLVSPSIHCRKLSAEMLIFFGSFDEHTDERLGLSLVFGAFDHVEQQLNAAIADVSFKVGRFDVWLRQLETLVDGRGRMGSMVGVNKEMKDSAGVMEVVVSTACCSRIGKPDNESGGSEEWC